MRIIIDMQGLQTSSGLRGVGRYTESLVKHLLMENEKHEFYLALNGAFPETIDTLRNKFSSLIPEDHIVVWQQFFDTTVRSAPSRSIIQAGEIIREIYLNSFEPDFIFSTNLQEGFVDPAVTSVHNLKYPVRYCTTLHDLVPFHYEEYLAEPTIRNWYNNKIDYAIASDVLLTVSESSKQDIIEKLAVPENKIFVIPNGCDSDIFNSSILSTDDSNKIAIKYGLSKRFVLYVGGGDKHKNIERLLFAYSILPDEIKNRVDLVLAGKDLSQNDNIHQTISDLRLTNNVITPGFVTDDDLPALYKMCECFAFPSTHEGFGLPALEAMACGVPVIGSNCSSIKEIINHKNALFDPYNVEDISRTLAAVLSDPAIKKTLIKNGLERASNYSWAKSARKLLDVFDDFDKAIGVKGYYFGNPVDAAVQEIHSISPPLELNDLINISKSIAESFPIIAKKTIYLDISSVVVHDYKTGIQRVTRAISGELLKAGISNIDVVLVYTATDDLNYYVASNYMRDQFGINRSPHDSYVEFKQNDILIFLDLHPGIAISHRGFISHLRNKGVKVIYVVYDILPLLKPDTFWPQLCKEFRLWAESVSSADGAVCISRAVAGELKEYLIRFGEKRSRAFNIGWFHLGADIGNTAPSLGFPADAALVLPLVVSRPSFLMVGTIEPRKGHRQTLLAFEALWDKGADINLVIVGKLGWGMHDFSHQLGEHSELGRHLFWLQGISDEYLEKTYEASCCLIAASEGEGFGLPLIEAAKHKLPIIARDIPVFREVAGENAFYFDPVNDANVLAETITKWLALYKNKSHRRSETMPWLTWKQSAADLLNVILNDDWLYKIECNGAISIGAIQNFCSRRLEWHGFNVIEDGFRWTDGNRASITFNWDDAVDFLQLRIRCSTFGQQRISLSLNNFDIYDETVHGDQVMLISNIPSLKRGHNVLQFNLPDARKPEAGDGRFLALAFREFEITKALGNITYGATLDHHSEELDWKGFSAPEDNFRWTESKQVSILFQTTGVAKKPELRIRCLTHGEQRVSLTLNGATIHNGKLNGENENLICSLPSLRDGYNILELNLPDAHQPGGSDSRLLALAIQEFEIMELDTDDLSECQALVQ